MRRINQGLSLKLKKNLINHWEIIIGYWEKSERSEALANKCGFFQKRADGFGVVAAVQPQEICVIFTLI